MRTVVWLGLSYISMRSSGGRVRKANALRTHRASTMFCAAGAILTIGRGDLSIALALSASAVVTVSSMSKLLPDER